MLIVLTCELVLTQILLQCQHLTILKLLLGKLVQGRTTVKGSNVMALSMLIFWNPESNTNALTTCFFSENTPDK